MIKRPIIWVVFAVLMVVVSVITIVTVRPSWGIDFTGGSLLEVAADNASPAQVREILQAASDREVTVQSTESGTILIRTAPLSEEEHQEVLSALKENNLFKEELRFESIGSTIGAELRRKAWIALSLAVVGMIAYLAYDFRGSHGFVKPWKFGVAAVLALGHDIIITTAIYVLVGRYTGASIDTLFITAMLAILGYSVNDTIVIFNRMQQEWILNRSAGIIELIDKAVWKTLIRSLNTAMATLLTLLVLFLLGGATIQWFVFTIGVGIIAGTYSSIFVAPPLLYFLAHRPAR